MKWKNRVLGTREDWAVALQSLTTQDEAHSLLREYRREEPEADRVVGYLTAELPLAAAIKARRLLGVAHPLIGDEPLTIPQLMRIGAAAASGHPPRWLTVVMSIPRVTWPREVEALARSHKSN